MSGPRLEPCSASNRSFRSSTLICTPSDARAQCCDLGRRGPCDLVRRHQRRAAHRARLLRVTARNGRGLPVWCALACPDPTLCLGTESSLLADRCAARPADHRPRAGRSRRARPSNEAVVRPTKAPGRARGLWGERSVRSARAYLPPSRSGSACPPPRLPCPAPQASSTRRHVARLLGGVDRPTPTI